MAQIHLTPGLTLLDAYRAANDAGMHLIVDDRGAVRVSPIVLPGWREIPLRIKNAAPDSGPILCAAQEAA
jgi:hypothetical protein